MRNLKNTKVFHELYGAAYYYGPSRKSERFGKDPIDTSATYRNIAKRLQKEYDGIDLVFSKDMAYCIEDHFEDFFQEGFGEFQHTFLIRHPSKAVLSLYRASTNKKLTGWDYFDPLEAGFRQMHELYKFLRKELGHLPVVVDADDLLQHPDQTLQCYCEAVGIPYEENMTSWEPGPVPEWEACVGWHEAVLKSSGFSKSADNKSSKHQAAHIEVPAEVQRVIEECIPFYEALKTVSISPKISQT